VNQGMVVAPQPEAVEAGVLILREGGNAVDAGVACGLVQGVVDPQMTGIAGFGICRHISQNIKSIPVLTFMVMHQQPLRPICGRISSKEKPEMGLVSS